MAGGVFNLTANQIYYHSYPWGRYHVTSLEAKTWVCSRLYQINFILGEKQRGLVCLGRLRLCGHNTAGTLKQAR